MSLDAGCQFCQLECPTHRKAESAAFSGQSYSGQLVGNANNRVRIVVIDQAERYVHDRHLNPQLQSNARPEVTDLVERRVADAEQ